MKKFFMVVNVDWFFLSHRLPLALKIKELGYDVFILAKDSGKKDQITNHGLKFIDMPFERSGKNPLNEFSVIRKLKGIFKKHQPTIIHNVTIKPAIYGSLAAKFAKLKNTQVVNAISGLGYNFTSDRDGLIQKVVKRLMKFAYSGNIKFIFQNPDDQRLYQEMGYLTDTNYRIIKGAGVDAIEYPYTEPPTSGKIIIVTTARMLKDKGIVELIEASQILKPKYKSKVCFQLVGDTDPGNPSTLTESDLKAAEVDGYLQWKGHHSNVKPVLQQSHIVCLPSYREGLPKSLIEAMAIGRPIVTTDVPGCRECIDDGINGYMVPPRDANELALALEKLILDSDLRYKMGLASRQKMVDELSLDKVLVETINFYDSE